MSWGSVQMKILEMAEVENMNEDRFLLHLLIYNL